jgi:hypothetical protein
VIESGPGSAKTIRCNEWPPLAGASGPAIVMTYRARYREGAEWRRFHRLCFSFPSPSAGLALLEDTGVNSG